MADRPTAPVVGQNLFFLPRVQAAAIGCDVRLARTEDDFWKAFDRDQPALVLVDLEGDQDTWPKVVEGVRNSGPPDVRMVAFGPHADVAGMERARALGCDPVLTKGEFSRDLPRVIEMARPGPAS